MHLWTEAFHREKKGRQISHHSSFSTVEFILKEDKYKIKFSSLHCASFCCPAYTHVPVALADSIYNTGMILNSWYSGEANLM